jgi:hypothetical protein
VAWDEKWFYIEHLFERRDGRIGARLIVRTLMRTKSGPVATADVLDALGHAGTASPPLPQEIATWIEVTL